MTFGQEPVLFFGLVFIVIPVVVMINQGNVKPQENCLREEYQQQVVPIFGQVVDRQSKRVTHDNHDSDGNRYDTGPAYCHTEYFIMVQYQVPVPPHLSSEVREDWVIRCSYPVTRKLYYTLEASVPLRLLANLPKSVFPSDDEKDLGRSPPYWALCILLIVGLGICWVGMQQTGWRLDMMGWMAIAFHGGVLACLALASPFRKASSMDQSPAHHLQTEVTTIIRDTPSMGGRSILKPVCHRLFLTTTRIMGGGGDNDHFFPYKTVFTGLFPLSVFLHIL